MCIIWYNLLIFAIHHSLKIATVVWTTSGATPSFNSASTRARLFAAAIPKHWEQGGGGVVWDLTQSNRYVIPAFWNVGTRIYIKKSMQHIWNAHHLAIEIDLRNPIEIVVFMGSGRWQRHLPMCSSQGIWCSEEHPCRSDSSKVDFNAADIKDGSKEVNFGGNKQVEAPGWTHQARKKAHEVILKHFGSFLNTETVRTLAFAFLSEELHGIAILLW